jgi:hypothetical protein
MSRLPFYIIKKRVRMDGRWSPWRWERHLGRFSHSQDALAAMLRVGHRKEWLERDIWFLGERQTYQKYRDDITRSAPKRRHSR